MKVYTLYVALPGHHGETLAQSDPRQPKSYNDVGGLVASPSPRHATIVPGREIRHISLPNFCEPA